MKKATRKGGEDIKHHLKCLPRFFQAIWCGDKTFEIRENDRGFQERHEIVIQEIEADDGTGIKYTGREVEGFITYMTDYNQKPGYVVFSFRETFRTES